MQVLELIEADDSPLQGGVVVIQLACEEKSVQRASYLLFRCKDLLGTKRIRGFELEREKS